MLKSMRKHARFFYVLFIIVILSFIFWGVGTVDKSGAPSVAEIGKERITAEEYWQAYDQMRTKLRETYKDQFNEEMEKKLKLKEAVLSSLIADRVLAVAAGDIGLTVTDEELQDVIIHEPAFMRNGVFNRDMYFRALQSAAANAGDVRKFSASAASFRQNETAYLVFCRGKPY